MALNPPIFPILSVAPAVTAILGTSPTRIYPYGRAPQDVAKPYVVYSLLEGTPENYIGDLPDADTKYTQISIYAENPSSVDALFIAIRNALEPYCHMTGYRTLDREAQTDLYGVAMDFDYLEGR